MFTSVFRRSRLVRAVAAFAFAGCTAFAQTPVPDAAAHAPKRYDGHKVVRADVRSPAQLQLVLSLTDDVWSHGVGIRPIEVRVSPGQFDALTAARDSGAGPAFTVVIDDVQALIDAERASIDRSRRERGPEWFADYKTWEEYLAKYDEFVAAHPDLATPFVVGKSLQGRDIKGITITGPGDPAGRPEILFNACQHAREWASPTTVTWIADRLLSDYATDPRVRSLLDHAVIHIVPFVNPDGYVFTWSDDRLWRKNLRGGYGVDLNRNWGYEWGGDGSSGSKSDETYRGTAAFSEPETAALRDFILAHPGLVAGIDYHTFSQLVLRPWGYADVVAPDEAALKSIGDRMAADIYSVHGAHYTSERGIELYAAAGNMFDWTYGQQHMMGFTIELRDTGADGFLLPKEQIIPTGEENYAAALGFIEHFAYPLRFVFPEGLPAYVSADPEAPSQVRVDIVGTTGVLERGSGSVFTRVGSGDFTEAPLTPLGGDSFSATLPAVSCGGRVEYYFSARATDGRTVLSPAGGAASPYAAEARIVRIAWYDDASSDLGWTVGAPGDTASRGIWNRMDPEATDAQPGDDATPGAGGMCWVTDGRAGSTIGSRDVDDGATTLTSPRLDASRPADLASAEAFLSLALWYSNDQGGAVDDTMPVLISADDGSTWAQIELLTGSTAGWAPRAWRLSDFITPSDRVRLRIVPRDEGSGSIVEAALDEVRLTFVGCPYRRSDCNRDGVLNINDFICFQSAWKKREPYGDFDASGTWTINDFIAFQQAFARGE